MDEVELDCAVYGEATMFPVKIALDAKVSALQEAIVNKKKPVNTLFDVDPSTVMLYLARKKQGENDEWLKSDVTIEGFLKRGRQQDGEYPYVKMIPNWKLKKKELLGPGFKPGDDEIHVLVELPQAAAGRHGESAFGMEEEPPHKKRRLRTTWKEEEFKSIEDQLDIDSWGVSGRSLGIHRVEPDFPDWFYVRKETADIFKIFKERMEANFSIVFKGTPGVGKSMLVVVLAFYMALRQRKRVVLFRKVKRAGYSMLYMDPEKKQYWRMDDADIEDIGRVVNRDFALCLDGLKHDDVTANFRRLARFRLLATSAQYPLKSDDNAVIKKCLVPFWSLSDLTVIGRNRQWSAQTVKDHYFYSGGSLRDFLSTETDTMISVQEAVDEVSKNEQVEILSSQHGSQSDDQVDRIRMTGIRATDPHDLLQYIDSSKWIYQITSEYALRCLGKIVKPSYYEELLKRGSMLGDDALIGIAFEMLMHSLAHAGEKIKLQVRAYDRRRVGNHTYAPWTIETKSCRNDGTNAAECAALMRELSTPHVDYWYPLTRSLVTIDCVTKLSVVADRDAVALIQITTSDRHSLDSVALDGCAAMFPTRRRYIALVPDKETCDEFRLAPADPETRVPLYVAYMTS